MIPATIRAILDRDGVELVLLIPEIPAPDVSGIGQPSPPLKMQVSLAVLREWMKADD